MSLLKIWDGSAWVYSNGGTPLTVEEVDGSPTDSAITKIVFPNGTLGIVSHVATYTPAGGGGGSIDIDDGSTTVTSATSLTFVGGTIVDLGGGAAEYTPASGGATLPLDITPGSPHAKDDEFSGVSLDVKWTDISVGSGLQWTTTVANGWLVAEPAQSGASSTGKHLMGIRQASPAGAFTVMGKLANVYRTDDTREGIFVSDGTRMHVCGYDTANGRGAMVIGCNNYSETIDAGSYDGFYGFNTVLQVSPLWVKIVWDTSILYFYFSFNGVLWDTLTTRSGMNQPTRIGVCQYSQNTGSLTADHTIACDWFRVTEP